jgi:hypothetical protein
LQGKCKEINFARKWQGKKQKLKEIARIFSDVQNFLQIISKILRMQNIICISGLSEGLNVKKISGEHSHELLPFLE